MPNGRDLIITAPSGGDRSGVVIPTGWEQDVSIPNPIDRPNRANDRGIIGPRRMDSFPTTGGLMFVGHVPLVHVAQGVVPSPANTVDDTAEIPAIFVGNPVTN
jgi:hypothetical protein